MAKLVPYNKPSWYMVERVYWKTPSKSIVVEIREDTQILMNQRTFG